MKKFTLFILLSLSLNAIKSNAQTWNLVGSEWFSSGPDFNNGIVIDTSGTPYVVFEDGGDSHKATVMKYNGSAWVYVGSEGFSAGGVQSPSMAIDRAGTLYVAYADSINGYKATVMKFNGSSWVNVGIAGFSGSGVSSSTPGTNTWIAIDTGGTPYVVFGDGIVSNKATVMKFNGSSWVTVGTEGFTSAGVSIFSIAIDSSGTPYVAYMDATFTNAVSVMKYNGSSWVTVGSAGFSSGMEDYISIAIGIGGTPYVAYSRDGPGGKASAMKYNGSSWVNVGAGAISAGEAQFTTIAIDGRGTPYVVYSDSAYSWKATLKKYTGSSWVTVGGGGFTAGSAGYTSLAIDGSGTPYVVYEDAYAGINRATVQKFVSTPILGTDSVCQGYTTHLSDITGGGTWSSSNTSIATVGTGSGIVTGVSVGTAVISYTISGSSDTVTVTVSTTPNPGTITGLSSVCASSIISLSDATLGGTWSSSNVAVGTVSSTGVVTGASAGTTTISYSVTNSCGTAITTKIITVNPLPNAGIIIGASFVCATSTITLSNTASGGTWSSSIISIATIGSSGIVTGASAGTTTISYTVTNSCSTTTTTKIVTVNPLPNAGSITGLPGVCVSSTINLTDSVSGGAWSAINSNATVGSTGIVSGAIAGVDTIKYIVTNSCGTTVATKIVTVNPLPNAGTIIGFTTVCIVSTIALTDASTGGVWASSILSVALVGSTGIVSGVSAGTTTISYSVTNSCGTVSATKIVTVNPAPNVDSISGPTSICSGGTITLTDTVSGGTWSSSTTTVATIGSLTGTVTGVSSGSTIISYTVTNSCGTTATATTTVTINPLPNAGLITGLSMICVSNSISLTDTVTGGLWSASNSNAFVSSFGVVLGVSGGVDTIKYSITNTCGTNSVTKVVTINPAPSAGIITGLDTVCVSSSIALTDTVSGGTWSASNGNAFVSSTGVVLGVTIGVDDITYTYTNTCGTGTTDKNIQVVSCTTGLSNITTPADILTISPNPTQNNITITSSETINNIVISNLIGQKVFSGSYQSNNVAVSLEQVPDGVYVVKINGDKAYKVVKH